MSSKKLVVSGSKALDVAEALTATTLKILQLLSEERLDVSTIGKRLGLSEAYISEQIHLLEELQLVKTSYERGEARDSEGMRIGCERNNNKNPGKACREIGLSSEEFERALSLIKT